MLVVGDPAGGGFALSESEMLVPGVRVRVGMGYDQHIRVVFEGIIARCGVRLAKDGMLQVTLTCTEAALAIAQPAAASNSCGLRVTCGESMSGFSAEMGAGDRPGSVSGTVSFPGSALPVPGKTIELAGVGARCNGDAFIARVEHTLEGGGWVTEVGFSLLPAGFDAGSAHAL